MSLLPQLNLDELIAESETIYHEAVSEYKPSKIFSLFSGGDDSLSATIFASRQEGFTGVVHINTGIGIKEANRFVRRTCSERGWPLIELHPTEKSYRDFVLEYGFPGAAAHKYCYIWLKEKPLRWFVANVAKNATRDKVMLITGVRLQESTRRMGYVQKIQEQGSRLWVAPFLYWSKLDCRNYIAQANVKRSPVVEFLHRSGECNCGAYAQKGELAEIALWYPEDAKQIYELQDEAKAKGVHSGWGTAPPPEKVILDDLDLPLLMLCQSCELQGEESKIEAEVD